MALQTENDAKAITLWRVRLANLVVAIDTNEAYWPSCSYRVVLIIVIFDEFDEQLSLATAATEEFFFDSCFHLIRYTYKHRYSQSAVIYIYIWHKARHRYLWQATLPAISDYRVVACARGSGLGENGRYVHHPQTTNGVVELFNGIW